MIRDGAYGTLLAPHLRGGEVADELCVREPARVVAAHRAYVQAGARVLQSNSFLAWRFGDRRRAELLLAALECADEAAAQLPVVDVRVMATLGPAGSEPRAYYRDLELLLGRERMLVTCETVADAATAQAFATAWHEVAQGVAATAVLSLTIAPSLGIDTWRWIASIDPPDGVDVGLNCCEGTAGLREPLELLADSGRPVHLAPSAGLPVEHAGAAPAWPEGPAAWAQTVATLAGAVPVATVGGCCGTTPDHVAALVEALASKG